MSEPTSPITQQPFIKMFWRRLIVGAGLALFFTWLALRNPQPVDAELAQRSFEAMGTQIDLVIALPKAADAENDSRARAETVLDAVQQQLERYAQRWSAWGEGAQLSNLNQQLARGEAIAIPEPMQGLFARAAQISALSGGRFDVRVGKLVALWGFDDVSHFRSAPPDAAAIDAAVAELARAPALNTDGTRYGPAPQVWLDFGAIAKGDASDLAIEHIAQAGFDSAMVNLGGNLRVMGQRSDRPWRVGIRHPRPELGQRLLATLQTQGNEAIVTSGDYEHYFESGGVRYHHLLDPKTGQPASSLQSVTVVTGDGTLADAASTALFVAGAQNWRSTARALGIDQVLVVDAQGQVLVTEALAARAVFPPEITAQTVP
ncbi:FAD:protein FMN transferase [Sinimarinibacterium sp. NLF-5-8]|uniref:FAD:protein FMN transferase n=1 Tax=Sinimarinibacterium sp. NLF-5-8 TaxID=2698684 RepID=UPI00137B99DB|nr:FAD:protein FMN transferase [Sinimarinibacterium sp. NLF-5-8]QHS09505.1 FAD:protein FMN transferase [Sinimarinibacterium sp. NLF-5-8]